MPVGRRGRSSLRPYTFEHTLQNITFCHKIKDRFSTRNAQSNFHNNEGLCLLLMGHSLPLCNCSNKNNNPPLPLLLPPPPPKKNNQTFTLFPLKTYNLCVHYFLNREREFCIMNIGKIKYVLECAPQGDNSQ